MERPIRYLRESFFYGRQFASDEDLNDQPQRWLEGTADVRQHGTTGERPLDRFERGGLWRSDHWTGHQAFAERSRRSTFPPSRESERSTPRGP